MICSMKILRNKTHRELLEDIEFYKNASSNCGKDLSEAENNIEQLQKALFYSSRRKVIVGCKGSGKSYTIKRDLIPQLNGNYFLLDLTMEYSHEGHGKNCLNEMEIREMIKERKTNPELSESYLRAKIILEHINDNRGKTLIIDGMDYMSNNLRQSGYHDIIDAITGCSGEQMFQDYILTFQSFKYSVDFFSRNGDFTTQSIMMLKDRGHNQIHLRNKFYKGDKNIIYAIGGFRNR